MGNQGSSPVHTIPVAVCQQAEDEGEEEDEGYRSLPLDSAAPPRRPRPGPCPALQLTMADTDTPAEAQEKFEAVQTALQAVTQRGVQLEYEVESLKDEREEREQEVGSVTPDVASLPGLTDCRVVVAAGAVRGGAAGGGGAGAGGRAGGGQEDTAAAAGAAGHLGQPARPAGLTRSDSGAVVTHTSNCMELQRDTRGKDGFSRARVER